MILKNRKNVLTKGFLCAKIGIVKVFFTIIENNFHFHTTQPHKKFVKMKIIFKNTEKARKEAKV